MALHPNFPDSPYETLLPEVRWFPAAEELRSTAYEKLLPPLVAKVREEVHDWRDAGYAGASATSRALLAWWFDTDHLIEQADGTLTQFRYYFAQREAVESVIWLHDVKKARDAVMHRTYENTNAPVRVYWFDDRIEITNPGGPFGTVTAENFGRPGFNDYRNPNLATVLKTLGFVQRFGFGIADARKALAENGNPPLEFQVEPTTVLATLRRAP